jgi:3-hydroxyisobutyrate dehydrogenase-like beta-hydroxyacid dehydrogenase
VTGTPRLALLGLGGMGGGLGARILATGHALTVYNRTTDKALALVAAGARLADSPADAVLDADVVLVSLSDEHAVETVVVAGALPAIRTGAVVLDATTTSPAYARAAEERFARAGVARLETCLLGNPLQARDGELRILVSGDPGRSRGLTPLLEQLGKQVRYVGPAGNATTMKLVFNALLGAQVVALAEAVSLGERAGLNPDKMLEAIADSGFSSKVMGFRANLMRTSAYRPAAFRTTLMAKDLRLAAEAGADVGADTPLIDTAAARFAEMVDAGWGDWDAAALLEYQRTPGPVPAA